MSQTSIERLRDYLAQLPPQAQALLMREFERAIDARRICSVRSNRFSSIAIFRYGRVRSAARRCCRCGNG